MKKLFAATLVIAAQFALAPLAAAADAKKPATPQQQRMRDCNADATGMKGQARKDFMKDCLSGKQAENKAAREARREERKEAREERQTARQSQQEKMKACNADAKAKGLAGPERKAFMSDCLKN
jgi:hypothetical protein